MNKTAVYQLRLQEQEKQAAFAVLAELGISPAQAIRLFLRQVVATRSIPFAIDSAKIDYAPSAAHLVQPPAAPPAPPHEQDVFDHLEDLLQGLHD